MSPFRIDMELNKNEEKCIDIYFFSEDYFGELYVYDRWDSENSSYLDIISSHSPSLFSGSRYVNSCFRANNPGVYNGEILFLSKDGFVEIGAKIKLNVTSENKESSFSLQLSNYNKPKLFLLVELILFTFIYLGTLIYLLGIYFK